MRVASSASPCQHRWFARRQTLDGRHSGRTRLLVRSPDNVDLKQAYTSQTYTAPSHRHGCEPGLFPGSGLGILATHDLRPGQLLMVVDNLCVCYGLRGLAPENSQLADVLLGQSNSMDDRQQRWLTLLLSRLPAEGEEFTEATEQQLQEAIALMSNSETSSNNGASTLGSAPIVHEGLDHPTPSMQAQQDAVPAAPAAGASSPSPQPPEGVTLDHLKLAGLDADTAAALVSSFAYSERYEDLAISELKEQQPESFLGLWPEAALLNHSCAPNTSCLVTGGQMFVFAAQPILEGDQLTACYLGQERFAPVAQRRTRLRSLYGFHCKCPRCTAEQQIYPTRYYPGLDDDILGLGPQQQQGWSDTLARLIRRLPQEKPPRPADDHTLLLATYQAAGELAAQMQTLSSKLGPTIQQQQEELLQQMAAQLARLEAGLALLGQPGQGAEGQRPPERTIAWFRASCYPLYRQVADAIELQQPGQPAQQLAQLRSCLAVVESAARGSDLHVLLAVKHAAKARLVHGGESAECRAADLAMGQAHVARYGPVQVELLGRMAQARRRLLVGSSVATQMGVMAWKQQTSEVTP